MDKETIIRDIKKAMGIWVTNGGAEAFYAAGYRKLPERPKVLTKEEVIKYLREHRHETQAIGEWGMFRAGNQAQLEADIRHYEGKDA